MLLNEKGAHTEHSWIVPACRESAHEAVVLSLGPFAVCRHARRALLEYCVVVLRHELAASN